MWKRLLLLFLLPMLVSCGQGRGLSPSAIFARFSSAYPLPAGKLYDSAASVGDAAYLPPRLFETLYLQEAEDAREDIDALVLYLAATREVWCELGIFLCADRSSAKEVAALVARRIREVERMQREYLLSGEAVLFIRGRYVILLALPDNEKGRRIIEKML